MTLADEALALGRELAVLDSGPGRPRQITLRKAIHCSYYAAFGSLCDEWAGTFATAAQPTASRMLAHGVVKDACTAIAGGGTLRGGATCPADLRSAARLIPQLQDRRHDADYDATARFTRARRSCCSTKPIR